MVFGDKMKDVINSIDKILKEMQSYTACFVGLGYTGQNIRYVNVIEMAKSQIERAIENGYHTFLCGMELGFDIICAEIVLGLKLKYPHIKLIGALSYKNQDSLWKGFQKEKYRKLLKQLDEIRCIYNKYEDGYTNERNKYMINNSSLVIALYDGQASETKRIIDYSKNQGLKVEIIKP